MDSLTCEKNLDQYGRTHWAFVNSKRNDTNFPCKIQAIPDKGLGIVASKSIESIQKGCKVITEFSFVCLPIGKHRARVCMKCLKFGHKKVKVSEECPDFYFCSLECLHSMDDMTTQCGGLVTQLFARHKNDAHLDSFLFATLLLYNRITSIRNNLPSLHWQQIMKQDGHSSSPQPALTKATQQFFSLLSTLAPHLLCPSDTIGTISYLLRVIQFNSQSFMVPELPHTSLMCHFNALSKLNHSCVPNAVLSLSIYSKYSTVSESTESGVAVAVASVIALRRISPGEELCVSYVSQLCVGIESRQQMLQQAFLFACYCPRCVLEQSALLHKTKAPSFDFSPLELANFQHVIRQLTQVSNVSRKLEAIDQKHVSYLLKCLAALQKSRTDQSCEQRGQQQALNKSIVKNVYLLHDAIMCVMDVTLSLKSLASTLATSCYWDSLVIRITDMLYQCWELSYSNIQFHEMSFFLIAATAAVRLISHSKRSLSSGSMSSASADFEGAVKIAEKLTRGGCARLDLLMGSGNDCDGNSRRNDSSSGNDNGSNVEDAGVFANTKRRLHQCLTIISGTCT